MKRANAGYDFTNLTIKRKTAAHFREFAKGLEHTNTDVLQAMIYFFEGYKISPYDTLDSHLERVENTFKKRLNAMIGIIKDIEKTKMSPTHEMLQLLFQEATREPETKPELKLEKGREYPGKSTSKKELLLEKNSPEKKTALDNSLEANDHYQAQYFEERKRVGELTRMLTKIWEGSTYVNPTFGTGYVKITMEKNAYEQMKMKSHVHHHHTTENRE